jgi:hypothetical protein
MINSWAALESTEAGTGRLITLNPPAFEELVRWASRFTNTRVEHYVFPCCEKRQTDATRPTRGWHTTWRNALKRAGVHCRFRDLRVTCITNLPEYQTSDQTIMSIAGHVLMPARSVHLSTASFTHSGTGIVRI